MRRIDVKITFNCNNHCDFCAQGDKRSRIKMKSFNEISRILKKARMDNIEGVVFTGGEPTLHPDIIKIVSKAKTLGFKYIQLQTNGRSFAYMDFCLALKKAGANEMSPSLHGSKSEIHERLTHSPGSFKEVVKGIINCKKIGMYVLTNSVITSLNYKDLPELARLLVYLNVDQYQLAFVHIIGTAWENKDWIVPKKSDIMPYVKKAMDIGIKNGKLCFTEAIPYCFMKGYEQCVAESIIPEGPVADADVFVENYAEYRKNEGKIKHEKCKKCFYYEKCEGPWREYPDMYGWSEFKPVKNREGKPE